MFSVHYWKLQLNSAYHGIHITVTLKNRNICKHGLQLNLCDLENKQLCRSIMDDKI